MYQQNVPFSGIVCPNISLEFVFPSRLCLYRGLTWPSVAKSVSFAILIVIVYSNVQLCIIINTRLLCNLVLIKKTKVLDSPCSSLDFEIM